MERRSFIKKSCITCGGIMALGTSFSFLESCASMPVFKASESDRIISVPIDKFLISNTVLVRTAWLSYDVLLVKKSEEIFNAIYLKCSHQDNILSATKTGLFCTTHGSIFDLDGNAMKEPAIDPLKKFKTVINNNTIDIYMDL
ncbi:MAG: Rieske 2Fe-2S domain-containing protein [Bacteroidetes bacterium]|nr:Rieske 2Fe-2S domain-containing protein [Bacteroidota bacterium]